MPNVKRIPERKQLEAFYERYQREGVPNDLSMQAFCSMHNVPYNCFERHLRQRVKFKNIKQGLGVSLLYADSIYYRRQR